MQEKRNNDNLKRILDISMTVLLLCLMAYQVTGEKLHEWGGIIMTLLVIVHQILNRRWYSSLFKGKYNAYRTLSTAVNILLFVGFFMTAICGMSMSGHAVPFLYGMLKVSFARQMHLSLSHWTFVFMGLHLGIHIPVIFSKIKASEKAKNILLAVFCCAAAFGLYFFLKNGLLDYMLFRVPFAFLDYEKAGALVFLENLLMLLLFAFIGMLSAAACKKKNKQPI